MPLVSFVVTYYNLPVGMLRECIDSLLALPLAVGEREIVVVDDGSSQSPVSELASYGSQVIYVRQANGGLSAARNKGLQMCTGRYVQFVDADDQLLASSYSRCLEVLGAEEPLDMVFFGMTHDATAVPPAHVRQTEVMGGAEYMGRFNLHGSACGYLFRRSALGDLRFTEGILHEDEEFTPQLLLRADRVVRVEAAAYFYRKRPSSITHQSDAAHVERRLNDKEGIVRRLHLLSGSLPAYEGKALRRRVSQLTMDYIYDTMRLTRSPEQLSQRLSRLEQLGLFPLPAAGYTWKYRCFRLLSRSAWGRRLLTGLLPKEK